MSTCSTEQEVATLYCVAEQRTSVDSCVLFIPGACFIPISVPKKEYVDRTQFCETLNCLWPKWPKAVLSIS